MIKQILFENLANLLENFYTSIQKDTKQINPNINDIEELDKYLLEINRFYYESFHKHFYPQYKSELEESISTIFRLSRQEEQIKSDILALLNRYAKHYNLVKNLQNKLLDLRDNANNHVLTLLRQEDKALLEMYYATRKLADSLKELLFFSNQLNELYEDKDLIRIFQKYPSHAAAITLLSDLDIKDNRQLESYNQLLIHLNFSKSLILKLENSNNSKLSMQISKELSQHTLSFLKAKTSFPLHGFYRKYFHNQFSIYMELISLYIQKQDNKKVNKMLKDFEDWLNSLIIAIEKCRPYIMAGKALILDNISTVSTEEIEQIKQILSSATSLEEDLNFILRDYEASPQADFHYFHQEISKLITKHYQAFYNIKSIYQSKFLTAVWISLEKVMLEMSLLESKLDLLHQKDLHSKNMNQDYLLLVQTLDFYLNMLANIKADLERILTPKSIAKSWPDMNISIQRFSLELGKPFPESHLFFIEEYQVEKHLDIEKKVASILYEEGDLFIIQLDDEQVVEMPNIIVSTRS